MSNKIIGYDNRLWRVDQEFSYTGTDQPFTVDPGTYLFICEGAHGGTGERGIKEYGGITYGEITLNQRTTFHAVVGSDGADYNSDYALCTGGFNGGGHGGMGCNSSYSNGPGGGGATDIRLLAYDEKEYPTYDDEGNVIDPVNTTNLKEYLHITEPTYGADGLPDRFERLEYISYDTIKLTSNIGYHPQGPSIKVNAEVMFLDSSRQDFVHGWNNGKKGSYTFYYQSNQIKGYVVKTDTTYNHQVMSSDIALNTKYTLSFLIGQTFSLYVDGSIKSSYIVGYDVTNAAMEIGYVDGDDRGFKGRMYRYQVYDGAELDELVVDLIPCHDTITNTDGLYDVIRHKYLMMSELTIPENPQDYIPLEYIYAIGKYGSSSYSGYFNTGYIPKANTKIEVDCCCFENTLVNYEILFGTRKGSYQYNAFVFFMRFNGNNVPTYNRSGVETVGSDFTYNERITLVCYRDKAEWFLHNSDTPRGSITTTGTIDDCVSPLLINMTNIYNGSNGVSANNDDYSKFKLYSFKISEINEDTSNEVVVRNYIPARRQSDNTIGLFDLVKNQFITQTGGAWLSGPPIYNHPSLNSRIMVAAGAGGGINESTSSNWYDGLSYGGGPYGSKSPGDTTGPDGFSGLIPSQTNGYAFGYGCHPTKRTSTYSYSGKGCGGGGGGWYSGYASQPHAQNANNMTRQGGGGCSYVLTSKSYKPDGYYPDSKYYFTKTLMHGGQAMGDLFSQNPEDWKNGRVYICKLESVLRKDDVIVYPCTGESVSHNLPAGQYKLKVWGGDGGSRGLTSHCKRGGYSEGIISTEINHTIYVYTGGSGGPNASIGYNENGFQSTVIASENLPSLKFNGGQTIQNLNYILSPSGGGTDIRFDEDDYDHRVIVAGGAGSEGKKNGLGGDGGGELGGIPDDGCAGSGTTAQNQLAYGSGRTTQVQATQSDGYAFGVGGAGTYKSSGYGGCGGGGWYGGCGTVPDGSSDDDRGGGGGSGYVLTDTSDKPGGYALLDDEYYLTETTTTQGGNNLPLWHTKTQIECISISARCICRDADGYKYYDKENNGWTLLPTQTLTPEVFEQYGNSILNDNGLMDAYYIYAYDPEEKATAVDLYVTPNTTVISYIVDRDISITSIMIDADFDKNVFKVSGSTSRIDLEDGTHKTAIDVSVSKLKDVDAEVKIYNIQIVSSGNHTSHEYLKLAPNGRRIFKHIWFDRITGEKMEEERTMELDDPANYIDDKGEVITAQWLLPVGSDKSVPTSYNYVVDGDVTNVYNTHMAEYDRTLYVGMGCRCSDNNLYYIIKAVNLMDDSISSVCKLPWSSVYTKSNYMFITSFLVDKNYFYLQLCSSSSVSTPYTNTLTRIHRTTFAVSQTTTAPYTMQYYGKLVWDDSHIIRAYGSGGYWMYYDTSKNTWTSEKIVNFNTNGLDYCIGTNKTLFSNNQYLYVIDNETNTYLNSITLNNNYAGRMAYHNGKFYIAQKNYFYIYDEESAEMTSRVISIMQYPNFATYCNGSIIIPQTNNTNQLIIYDIDAEAIQTRYLPWTFSSSGFGNSSNAHYIPYESQGYYFYMITTQLVMNYSGYYKYKFGRKFDENTLFTNVSTSTSIETDDRFVTLESSYVMTKNGYMSYPLGEYNNDHIARTELVSKSDYRYLKGSMTRTIEEGE